MLLKMELILIKLYMPAHNTYMEGTVSQIFYLSLGFHFMLKKTGRFGLFFLTLFSTFHKRKTRTYITILRHGSLYLNVI